MKSLHFLKSNTSRIVKKIFEISKNHNPLNQNDKNLKRIEKGRSMVEMLGVLAVVGVLSIGGISGYKYAMNKYNANNIAYEVNMRATDIYNRFNNNKFLETEALNQEWSATTANGYPIRIESYPEENFFEITVEDVSPAVCQETLKNTFSYPYRVFVKTDEETELVQDSSSLCSSKNKKEVWISYIFSDDEEAMYQVCFDDEQCAPCQKCNRATERCEEACIGGALCSDAGCCIPEMACGETCCSPEKSLCVNNTCVSPDDKECTSNADCGAGYYCQIGTSSACSGNNAPINRCKKAVVKKIKDGNTVWGVSNQGAYTFYDSENFCNAINMELVKDEDLLACYERQCPLADEKETMYMYAFTATPVSGNSCKTHMVFFGCDAVRERSKNERMGKIRCVKHLNQENCGDGFVWDEEKNECVCSIDGACFKINPEMPICREGNCIQCRSDDDCTQNTQKPHCELSTNMCVECTQNEDCTNAAAPKCLNNICTKCSTDADCTNASQPYCNDLGVCTQCYNSSQCKNSSKPICRIKTLAGSAGKEQCYEKRDGYCTTAPYTTKTFSTSYGDFKFGYFSGFRTGYGDNQFYCEYLNKMDEKGGWRMASTDDFNCGFTTLKRNESCNTSKFKEFSQKTGVGFGLYINGADQACNSYYIYNTGVVNMIPKEWTSYEGSTVYVACIRPK